MTTNRDFSSPADYGLPSERELARLASAYFPEFCPAAAGANGAVDYAAAISPGAAAPGGASPRTAYRPTLASVGAAEEAEAAARRPGFSFSGADPAQTQAVPAPYVGDIPLDRLRADFPILSERIPGGGRLVGLDNAATTQRPRQVIDRIAHFYAHENSNVHRGAHALAARATDAYEDARAKIARFIGAPGPDNIVFVRGTTEAINLVAHSFVKPLLRPGDEIILTLLEHHANIVPWQIVAAETGAVLRVAPTDDTGQIILPDYAALFNARTRFVSAAHVSNALGTITPIEEIIAVAHGFGVPVCVDGAQSISHMPIDVSALDADFFAFSGHKVFGPMGIGALYGKKALLDAAEPYQGGGNMIADVSFARTLYHAAPQKFEAGTGSIADAVGLGAAIDYVRAIGPAAIAAYEQALLAYATELLSRVPGLRFIGTAAHKASVLSFVIEGRASSEVGKYLSDRGIAVRAGHHCAQPILRRFGVEETVRPSLAFYNTAQELAFLAQTLRELTR
ncbi:MAG: cysteine desulfurase [Clostridiales Family XIII bacterium]|jgi:cysteine desulfurase/selenocysteine lyase|nr:cysteine desulfurase [Clostridiales Family XIII bacterium]